MKEFMSKLGKVQKVSVTALAVLLLVSVFGINAASSQVRADEPVTPPSQPQDVCKNGGWMSFTVAPGPFKNQGQCVSHFAKSKHLPSPSVSPTP